jgi:hypothetical protein
VGNLNGKFLRAEPCYDYEQSLLSIDSLQLLKMGGSTDFGLCHLADIGAELL